MLALGTQLPPFSLEDTVTGARVDSSIFVGSVGIVAFICNHCPYVKHIQRELAEFGRYALERGVKMVAISSNDVTSYPEDRPERMAEEARRAGYPFPYLYDDEQEVAKAFHAACTPELYFFDKAGRLAYRGRFDESTPKNQVPVTGRDARAALDAMLAGRAPDPDQKASIGCSIKWREGNEPEYT